MSAVSHSHSGRREPLFLADHGALDFINTVMQIDGQPRDLFQSDEDVYAWLGQYGVAVEHNVNESEPGALLGEARRLRETIRSLVEQKKVGKPVEVEKLNHYLVGASSYIQLVAGAEGRFHMERVYVKHPKARLLGPVAEEAASLIAEPRFELVRKCEHPECSLWFYDRTKSHRRRWCSMSLCGNRAKVTRFRQQKK